MGIKLNNLGDTGIKVSAIGLGTTKFGRNTNVKYPHSFQLPSDQQILDILTIAKEHGINLLDTAPAYGTCEERLGKLLGSTRNDWIIVSKAGEEYINHESVFNFTQDYILQSIKRSLKLLNTDYIDVLLIHSNGDDQEIIERYDVFGSLEIAKQQGLIRAGGMSTKTVAGGLLTLEHSDVAMVCYNPDYTAELPVIEAATEQNKGILIKKALDSGHLPAAESIARVTQLPGVSSTLVGTINPQHLANNIAAASSQKIDAHAG